MARCRDYNWRVSNDGSNALSVEHAILAVLMDVRDELKLMNQRLQCRETQMIPKYLRDIRRNTTRKKRRA